MKGSIKIISYTTWILGIKKRNIRLIIPSSRLSGCGLRVHLFWKYFENDLFSRIILGVDQAFIWTKATICVKISFPPTNFVCLLFSYYFKYLYIFCNSEGSGRRYCLCKNIYLPSPISVASFLIIILIHYYFLILGMVQADANVCSKFSFPPTNFIFLF